MIITCEECGTRFNLNEELIKPQGSKVRCSKCKAVFVAHPPVRPEVTPAADSAAPGEEMLGTGLQAEGLEEPESLSAEAANLFVSPGLGEDDLRFDVPGQPPAPPADDIAEADLETPDGLDFSDLDQMFADGEEIIGGEVGDDVEDLDLSELKQMLESEEAHGGVEDAASVPEELELDLGEVSAEEEPVAAEAGDELPGGTEEMDLSELEKMLESEETPSGVQDAASAPEELELDLGEVSAEEEPVAAEAGDELPGGTEELDLSEIEKMFETEGETTDTFEDAAELELDLDLPDGSLEEKIKVGAADATEVDDFELADLEDVFETEPPDAREDTFETEDMDLDFEIEEFDQTETAGTADDLNERVTEAEPQEAAFAIANQAKPTTEAPAENESEPMATMTAAPPMTMRKKRKNAPLWVLLILLILGGGAFGAYTVLNRMGIDVPFAKHLANLDIELPFIGRLTKPKIQDPGNLKIKTFEITSRFVTNAQDGKLFVISGQVKNEYPESRDAISITGKLYTKGKVEARSETVFCGNILSDTELADLGVKAIIQRLVKPFGSGDANRAVKPGASLPFMVVFGNLPDDLEEFTLEVAGSSTAQ